MHSLKYTMYMQASVFVAKMKETPNYNQLLWPGFSFLKTAIADSGIVSD